MKVIDKGIPTKLKFGNNRKLNFITISSTNPTCDENFEKARSIFIQNGQIMESECGRKERLLVLSTFNLSNIQKMILFPGEYFDSSTFKLKIILAFWRKQHFYIKFKVKYAFNMLLCYN